MKSKTTASLRQTEIERVARLLQAANNHNRQRRHNLQPTPWEREYGCIKDSYRAMARAVIADRRRGVGRS